MERPVRVLLVEDNPVFREALELLLGLRGDVTVVASVGDGDEAVRAARAHAPDVVVMDYRMPGLDGVEAVAAVGEGAPAAAIMCLTAEASPGEVEALYAAGAVEVLTKDSQLGEIVDAIMRAAGRLAPAE